VPDKLRITDATLDVLEVLLRPGDELYGFKIAQAIGRPTGSVFPILARLERAHWAESEWEKANDQSRQWGARRRFYRLSSEGKAWAQAVLAERRPTEVRSNPRVRCAEIHNILQPRALGAQ
jgi:PadR family transcriptional regulator PadR